MFVLFYYFFNATRDPGILISEWRKNDSFVFVCVKKHGTSGYSQEQSTKRKTFVISRCSLWLLINIYTNYQSEKSDHQVNLDPSSSIDIQFFTSVLVVDFPIHHTHTCTHSKHLSFINMDWFLYSSIIIFSLVLFSWTI